MQRHDVRHCEAVCREIMQMSEKKKRVSSIRSLGIGMSFVLGSVSHHVNI